MNKHSFLCHFMKFYSKALTQTQTKYKISKCIIDKRSGGSGYSIIHVFNRIASNVMCNP